jgi:fermentation-respiration switch protein FrsA (DUF1100 family)
MANLRSPLARTLALAVPFLLIVYALLRGPLNVERLFFKPEPLDELDPSVSGLAFEEVTIPTADGQRLHGWWLPARSPAQAPTMLHLHSGTGNMLSNLLQIDWLPPAGCNVLMVDYRGFGRSSGKPTLDGSVEDGLAALRYLRSRSDVDAARLVVFGQGLGGATALRVLARDHAGVKLALIDSAFASYREFVLDGARTSRVLAAMAPVVALSLPGTDEDPESVVAKIDVPLLLIHGTDDQEVPYQRAAELLGRAREPRRILLIEHGMHLDGTLRPSVRRAILLALREATLDQ